MEITNVGLDFTSLKIIEVGNNKHFLTGICCIYSNDGIEPADEYVDEVDFVYDIIHRRVYLNPEQLVKGFTLSPEEAEFLCDTLIENIDTNVLHI